MGIPNIFSTGKGNSRENLDKGLEKTRESLLKKVSRAVVGKSRIDDEVLDKLEEALISSDVGVETTLKIIQQIQQRAAKEKYLNANELNTILKTEIISLDWNRFSFRFGALLFR